MKAIVCEEFAPVEQLKYQDVPDPVATKGHVVVDVTACGVNFPDGLLVQGKVKVVVDEVVSLENAKNALNKVMNRQVKGKMTLRP
jgi:NADPH:quinone reductase-like Zn-dependent oxidoreductase